MRQKIYNVLNKIYGIMMTVSFFAGILPLFPFIIAIVLFYAMIKNIDAYNNEPRNIYGNWTFLSLAR